MKEQLFQSWYNKQFCINAKYIEIESLVHSAHKIKSNRNTHTHQLKVSIGRKQNTLLILDLLLFLVYATKKHDPKEKSQYNVFCRTMLFIIYNCGTRKMVHQ